MEAKTQLGRQMRKTGNTCLLISLLVLVTPFCCTCTVNSTVGVRCLPKERTALLNFKHSLLYFHQHISSTWEGDDCCSWSRVTCHHSTGHVLQLHLHGHYNYTRYNVTSLLELNKSSSLEFLVELKELQYLDLSCNTIHTSSFPKFMGSMKQLRYLNLSNSNMEGMIPPELGNLTNLRVLDLGANNLMIENNLVWALSLRDLRYLNLQTNYFVPSDNLSNNLTVETNLWGILNNLCSLRFLDLSDITLQDSFLRPPQNSSNHCQHYDLEHLSLHHTNLNGDIPFSFGEGLDNLKYLDLSSNNISGEIPTSLGNLSALESLFLGENKLSGRIPTSVGQLSKLQTFYISGNPMEGTILSETHFAKLSSLTRLIMDDTYLTLQLPSDWVPPFQLQLFWAGTCKINGQFPSWLRTQPHLQDLSLEQTNISGPMPKWLHTMIQLQYLDLSNNQISGPPIFLINIIEYDLSNNSLSGPLMSMAKNIVYSNATRIYLDQNFISDHLPQDLGHIFPNIMGLLLSNNQINGSIPKSLCDLQHINVLMLENNSLSGPVPNCWNNSHEMELMRLSHNKLEGGIPCFNNSPYLEYLHLSDNLFNGVIPSCFSHLASLKILDVGGNQLSGVIPKWINAKNFPGLSILKLRGNKFSGIIPSQICGLSWLQILDIGHNCLTGSIPQCLGNLTAMISLSGNWIHNSFDYGDEMDEVIQGREYSYTSSLEYLVDIDLSCNNLVGSIPDEIFNLSLLMNLNLSYNNLSGTIPQNIGGLRAMISLDLSRNQLWGPIPRSISELYQLSHLNVSYNNLSGQIPSGTQLQTLLDPSTYAGNPYLCGDPLPKKCNSDKDNVGNPHEDDKADKLEKLWFDLSILSGLATGFWGVVGSLMFKKSWRHAVFRYSEDAYDWVYVVVVVRFAKLKKSAINNSRDGVIHAAKRKDIKNLW